MDTKLKSIRYSSVTKGIAVFLVWLCFMSAAASGIFLLYNQEILSSSNYYQTWEFKQEFSRVLYDTVDYHVKLNSEAAEDEQRFQQIKSSLGNMVNFVYFISDTESEKAFSNLKDGEGLEILKKQPSYTYMDSKMSRDYQLWYVEEIRNTLSGTKFEVHAAIVEPLREGDVFYNTYTNYTKIKSMASYAIVLLVISLTIMLAAFIYLLYVAGRKDENSEIVVAAIDRIYTDVHTFLVLIAAFISVAAVAEVSNGGDSALFIAGGIILNIDVCIGLSYVLSMVRQIKSRQILRNSLTYKAFAVIRNYAVYAFNGKLFKAWILLVLLGYGVVNSVLFAAFYSAFRYGGSFDFLVSSALLLGFNFTILYFAAKSLKNLMEIMEAAKEISSGNLDYPINSKEMSAAFAGFAGNLQGIQKGLQKAVAEAVKGERMKTELITNVSHDLKTPLTSIINYVDLLKKEELDNVKAQEYLLILEEKSARLKQLIEDLIEASKASSGNLVVTTEKVDLHQLVMQAYGEYEEKIEKAGLEIRTNIAEQDILVKADGKHLWRIVENLLSNTLKYSMMNSRVYINLDKNDQYGLLTIKNISAFPLDITPEQLTERFVRGDASRTTEGSGLGLSIAQSLTHLQGGRFKVEIDGDLFKVIVELPLWKEE